MSQFTMKNVRTDDPVGIAEMESFLLLHPDENVRPRPEAQFKMALNIGQGFVVQQDGETCGCSLVYKFQPGPNGYAYSEIGTMRIETNGSFNMQAFLAKFHLFQIYIEEFEPGQLNQVFGVVKADTASEHILKNKVSMSPWAPPPPALVSERGRAGLPFQSDKYVLHATEQTFKEAFADLREWHISDNQFQTPKNSGNITVLLNWFDQTLLNLF